MRIFVVFCGLMISISNVAISERSEAGHYETNRVRDHLSELLKNEGESKAQSELLEQISRKNAFDLSALIKSLEETVAAQTINLDAKQRTELTVKSREQLLVAIEKNDFKPGVTKQNFIFSRGGKVDVHEVRWLLSDRRLDPALKYFRTKNPKADLDSTLLVIADIPTPSPLNGDGNLFDRSFVYAFNTDAVANIEFSTDLLGSKIAARGDLKLPGLSQHRSRYLREVFGPDVKNVLVMNKTTYDNQELNQSVAVSLLAYLAETKVLEIPSSLYEAKPLVDIDKLCLRAWGAVEWQRAYDLVPKLKDNIATAAEASGAGINELNKIFQRASAEAAFNNMRFLSSTELQVRIKAKAQYYLAQGATREQIIESFLKASNSEADGLPVVDFRLVKDNATGSLNVDSKITLNYFRVYSHFFALLLNE